MQIIAIIVGCAVACFAAFSWGFMRGQEVALQHLYIYQKNATAEVALGQYTIYKGLVDNIKANKLQDALCSASLGASSSLDDVKTCMADDQCSLLLSKKISDTAPEVLRDGPFSFEYLESENGIRFCARHTEESP